MTTNSYSNSNLDFGAYIPQILASTDTLQIILSRNRTKVVTQDGNPRFSLHLRGYWAAKAIHRLVWDLLECRLRRCLWSILGLEILPSELDKIVYKSNDKLKFLHWQARWGIMWQITLSLLVIHYHSYHQSHCYHHHHHHHHYY